MLRQQLVGGAGGTLLLLIATLSASGCASSTTPALTPPPAEELRELEISPEAAARAEQLLAKAALFEPELTALLEAGAERLDVHLYGLQHRIKGRSSLERKIQTEMLRTGLPAEEVQIDDVVRYTVILDDEPAGDFDRTTAEILARADERGYEVVEVKNYWPPGDTYSGVNCALREPGGLLWELQFHTIGSLAAKTEGHYLYEELRLPTTPLERQREIFDRLAERWSWVEIPADVLVENSLHANEEIILRSRP